MDDSSHRDDRPPTHLSSRHSAEQQTDVLKRLKGKTSFADDPEHQRYLALLHGASPEQRLLLARRTLPRSLEQNARHSSFSLIFAILFAVAGIGVTLSYLLVIVPAQRHMGFAAHFATCLSFNGLVGVISWNSFKAYRRQRAEAVYCRDKLIELADGLPDNDPPGKVIREEAAA